MNRKSLLIWHRRIALALAPLFLLQAMTGLLLLIPPPSLAVTSGPTLPPSALVAGAMRAAPGFQAFRLDYPPDAPVVARMSNPQGQRLFVTINPATARVLDQGTMWHDPWRIAQEWHNSLFSGPIGSTLVAVEATALLALAISGIIFWWPGKGRLRQGLSIPARAPKRLRLRLWHRSTGVIASALLGMMAVTGLLLVWPLIAPPGAGPLRADPAPMLDAAYARAALPGQPLRDIRLAPSGHATFHFAAHSRNHWDLDTVTIAPDGRPRVIRAADAPALWMRLLPLHTGDALGIFGQIIIALVGGALLFLTISGVIAWNRARKGKSK
ncbi:PepSY-associated TM helix domain-containing protein [Novosphingobium sediminicola]|uniref:Putative iron-regulated membrane protein n=1 Tax=Novosphingobium sediminicola TaxID=563162 RepID=A0A7W6CN68_9SPHN|nr:PepSY-associated TM helix domain-containing protein [Novosphingobium sediminicola]MBB3954562.1 putative iron-regulated membrane protein [Novosphingobium sediminicola]